MAWFLAVVLCCGLIPSTSAASYIEIDDAAGLFWFAEQVNGGNTDLNVRLTADITVNTGSLTGYGGTSSHSWQSWIPIGSLARPFTGVFDGQGHTISGLFFNDAQSGYTGLFGYSKGIIEDVTVDNSWFSALMYAGGICGYSKGHISGCKFSGTIHGAADQSGGICGAQSQGVITNCINAGINAIR